MVKKSPQLENGYVKIANEVFDALVRFRIPGVERQCLDFIIRKTYGFNKKSDWISNSQFVAATGLKKGNISKAIKALVDKNIVIKNDNGKVPSYQFNKHYSQWVVLSKKKPVIKKDTVVIKKHNKQLSKSMDTKDIKDTLQKTLIVTFDFWNEKEIIKHRKLTQQIAGHIKSKLEDYSLEEIKKTIQNYSDILKSEKYFPNYRWTLTEFLTRNNGFEKYHDNAFPFDNFKKYEKHNQKTEWQESKAQESKAVDQETQKKMNKLSLIASGKAGHNIVIDYAQGNESYIEMQQRASRELQNLKRG